MKKLLFIPMDYIYNPYQELLEAFKQRFDCMYYTDQKSAIEFKPDFVFVHSSAIPTEQLKQIRENGAFVIQWTGNVRDYLLPEVVAYKGVCDLTLLASGIAQKKEYEEALGHPVKYLQHKVSNSQFSRVKEMNEGKIVFVGNNYNQFPGAVERTELCELLTNTFENFEVWGNGFSDGRYRNPGSIEWQKTQELYNNSYIAISANCFNDLEYYYSDRPLHIMAAGCCCLMRYVPKLENVFTDMTHCAFYTTREEAIEKIKYLQKFPDQRNKIARLGQQEVFMRHTNKHRVQEIASYLNYS